MSHPGDKSFFLVSNGDCHCLDNDRRENVVLDAASPA